MTTETIDPTNIPSTLRKLAVPIDGLQHYAKNARKGDLSVIMESLEVHGQYRPVVVRTGTNEILAGNHTVMAARELGWTSVAVTFVDVDDDEAARIVLIDNRANDLGKYDNDALAELLQSLPELEGTGYTQDDLDDLLAHMEGDDLDDLEDEYGEPEEEDLWPTFSIKLPEDLNRRLRDALDAMQGDTDPARLEQLLNKAGV
ncbi:ParB/RepB/Spo0J family partition protein [Arthrobacter sulfonylureivorans]|uniref:ParB/RepB/Spo0J family partition protein n=1 Tax=Arthrobacter sulfonylureivorans TaxID=2486855 RepID=UPI0039E3E579